MAEPIAESTAPSTEAPRTREKLDELEKAAALQYSLKNFVAASDLYADAVELQAELNGEMAPENAELLFYYGRALYKVAIARSDVLGNKVTNEEKSKKSEKKANKEASGESSAAANGASSDKKDGVVNTKAYFQLTGDENWDDSEDEEDDENEGEGAEEEADDFQNSFEVFEISRVLYTKKLEALDSADKGKGKAETGI